MGRGFSKDFRLMIVKLHLYEGRTILSLAAEYGVAVSTIGRWVTIFKNTGYIGKHEGDC